MKKGGKLIKPVDRPENVNTGSFLILNNLIYLSKKGELLFGFSFFLLYTYHTFKFGYTNE